MRIVSVQRHTTIHGGGELVAAWILEALKDEHELTVLGWREPDWPTINAYYGTSLSLDQIAFIRAPRPLDAALTVAGSGRIEAMRFQRFAAFMRAARPVVARFDLAISPLDEFDFGLPGLQYVHYPWLQFAMPGDRRPLVEPDRPRPWMRLARFSLERVRANSTAVNSEYTAKATRAVLGVEPEVIHPPCPGSFAPRPWDARSDVVVMIARLAPHKRFDLAVEAVRSLRLRGVDVRLRVVGNARGISRADLASVRRLLSPEPWIELREDVRREELLTLIAEARYGIHPMEDEPYGIAVAEMVRSGCIPLTRRSGGPPEITGGDPRLLFDSAEEAAERLLRLMRSPGDRDELRARLRRRAAILEPEAFMSRIRDWVGRASRSR